MDLLEKFNALTVEADTRISPSDRDFCEKHQTAYEAAIQSFRELSFFWADMEKTQRELLAGQPDSQASYIQSLLITHIAQIRPVDKVAKKALR